MMLEEPFAICGHVIVAFKKNCVWVCLQKRASSTLMFPCVVTFFVLRHFTLFFVSGVGCNFGSVANKDFETNNATGCGSLWATNGVILSSGTTCTVACISGYSSVVSDVYCDGSTFKASSASGNALTSPSWWDCAGELYFCSPSLHPF